MPHSDNSTTPAPFSSVSLLRCVKFGVVGGSGVFVNAGLLYAFTEWAHFDYRVASIVAIELSILTNFLWNHRWTWRDRPLATRGALLLRLGKFNLSTGLVAFVVNWGILVVLTEHAGLHYQVANLIGIAFGAVANFTISHFWTFLPRKECGSGA